MEGGGGSQEGEGGGALAALDLQNRDNTTLDDERTDGRRAPRAERSERSKASKQPAERDEDR